MTIDSASPEIIISLFLFLTIPIGCMAIKFILKKSKPPLLKMGDIAPDFDLTGALGAQVRLSDYRGKNIVLVFYPEGYTVDSTKQLSFFRDEYNQFELLETKIIAITGLVMRSQSERFSNGWHFEELEDYVRQHQLNYPVLVDKNGSVSQSYGSSGYFGLTLISKTIFLIDKQGVIQWVSSGLGVRQELIAKIKELS